MLRPLCLLEGSTPAASGLSVVGPPHSAQLDLFPSGHLSASAEEETEAEWRVTAWSQSIDHGVGGQRSPVDALLGPCWKGGRSPDQPELVTPLPGAHTPP